MRLDAPRFAVYDMRMSAFQVSISKHTDAAAATREAIDLLGGMSRFVNPGERVLIKPNGLFQTYRLGAVAEPAVVAEAARLVLEAGGKPLIGENDLVYNPESPKFETSVGKRYYEALAAIGLAQAVPLVDVTAGEMREVDFPDGKVIKNSVITPVIFDVEKIIDIPILKTHDQTQVSLGIKNLKGLLPVSERIRYHETSVEQAIVDLCGFVKPHLTIIDATTAGEGLGPGECTPVKMDLVIAGANTLATDMVGAAVMGFEVSRIKFLKYAIAAGLGPKSLDEVEVVGHSIASVARRFETAEEVACRQYAEMGVEVISQNVCSGCWAEFRHIYYSLGPDRAKLAGVTFALGRLEELPERDKVVVIGNCAKAVAGCGRHVPGCPPHHFEIDAAAREVSGLGGEPKKLG